MCYRTEWWRVSRGNRSCFIASHTLISRYRPEWPRVGALNLLELRGGNCEDKRSLSDHVFTSKQAFQTLLRSACEEAPGLERAAAGLRSVSDTDREADTVCVCTCFSFFLWIVLTWPHSSSSPSLLVLSCCWIGTQVLSFPRRLGWAEPPSAAWALLPQQDLALNDPKPNTKHWWMNRTHPQSLSLLIAPKSNQAHSPAISENRNIQQHAVA